MSNRLNRTKNREREDRVREDRRQRIEDRKRLDVVEKGEFVGARAGCAGGRVRDKGGTTVKSVKSGSGLRHRLRATFQDSAADGGWASDGVQLRRLGFLR